MSLLTAVPLTAQDVDISSLYNPATKLQGATNLGDLLTSNILKVIFVLVGVIFLVNLITAGWEYMMSTGDPKKVSAATTRFLNSFIGLVVAVTAFVVIRIVAQMIGVGGVKDAGF